VTLLVGLIILNTFDNGYSVTQLLYIYSFKII